MSWQLLKLGNRYLRVHYTALSTFIYVWEKVKKKDNYKHIVNDHFYSNEWAYNFLSILIYNFLLL